MQQAGKVSDEVEQASTRLKELAREISKLEAQQVGCCSRPLSLVLHIQLHLHWQREQQFSGNGLR